MIATLPRFLLRLAAVGLLMMAFGVTYPMFARAQSAADTAQPDENKPDEPAVSNGESAKPADAAPANAGASAPSGSPAGSTSSTGPDSLTKPYSSGKTDSSAKSDTPSSGNYELHEAAKEFSSPAHTGDETFDRASDSFPAFCKDWERRLHDRELNNQENVTWKDKDGFKTGTYLAYSPIKTCACKRSTGGVPIGELTYQETEYYLAGRTVEEARHTQPKPVGITNTTEIFRWDRTKWDYGR
jgi:hypothetical protein